MSGRNPASASSTTKRSTSPAYRRATPSAVGSWPIDASILSAGPFNARPPTIGLTARSGRCRREGLAVARERENGADTDERVGRADDEQLRIGDGSEDRIGRAGFGHAVEVDPVSGRLSGAGGRSTPGSRGDRHRSRGGCAAGHRWRAGVSSLHAQGRRHGGGRIGQAGTIAEQEGAVRVGGEVGVTDGERRRRAARTRVRAEGRPDPPSPFGIDQPGKRVEQGIQVGADVEAVGPVRRRRCWQ